MFRSALVAAVVGVALAMAPAAEAWEVKNFSVRDAGSSLRYRLTVCSERSAPVRIKVMVYEDDGDWIDALTRRSFRRTGPRAGGCRAYTLRQSDTFDTGDYAAQVAVTHRGATKWAPVEQFRIS